MSVRRKCFLAMLAGLFAAVGACAAFSQTPAAVPAGSADAQSGEQQPKKQRPEVFFPMTDQPEMEMHQHGQISVVMPEFPRLGESQRVVSGAIYELKDLEKMASAHNPMLAQAQREIKAAREQKVQAGVERNKTDGSRRDATPGR